MQYNNQIYEKLAQYSPWKLEVSTRKLSLSNSFYDILGIPEMNEFKIEDFSNILNLTDKNFLNFCNQKNTDIISFEQTYKVTTSKRFIRVAAYSDKKNLIIDGIIQDVTEKMKMLNDHKNQLDFYNRIIDSVPAMIFIKDAKELRFTLLNKAGEEITGLKSKDLIGKNDHDFFPKEQADFFTKSDRNVLAEKKTLHIEQEKINTPTGEKILQTNKVPIYDNEGHPTFLLGISNDITDKINIEKKLKEEQVKLIHASKLSLLGEMSSGIAHEIKNPLTIIYGNLRQLDEQRDNDEAFEKIKQTMIRSADKINHIINGLRKFSRLDEHKELTVCSIKTIINESISLIQHNIKNLSIDLQLDIESVANIACDEISIEQVFVNLLNNSIYAIRTLPNRWIKISVKTEDKKVIISFMDSGPRISDSVIEKIFQPFFTTKPIGEGTGLGMSISKGIIEDHKGTISIDKKSETTNFIITLPTC